MRTDWTWADRVVITARWVYVISIGVAAVGTVWWVIRLIRLLTSTQADPNAGGAHIIVALLGGTILFGLIGASYHLSHPRRRPTPGELERFE